MNRRTFLRAGMGAVGLATAGWQTLTVRRVGAAQEVKFTLPFLPVGGHAFEFVAQQKGFWKKRGLEVQIDRGSGSAEAAKAVGLGHYRFGEASYSVAIPLMEKGIELVCLAVKLQRSPQCVLALKEKNITQPRDLEGKTVATVVASGAHQLWPAFVKATGINEKAVKLVQVSPAARTQTVLEKKVDASLAYLVSDGAQFAGQLGGPQALNIIMYSDYGVDMLDLGLIAERKTVESAPELCAAFVEGAMEGLKFAFLNPEESLRTHLGAVAAYQGAPRSEKVLEYGLGFTMALSFAPVAEEKGLGWMRREDFERDLDLLEKYMGLRQRPAVDKIFTNKFAGTVKLTAEEWGRAKAHYLRYLPKKT